MNPVTSRIFVFRNGRKERIDVGYPVPKVFDLSEERSPASFRTLMIPGEVVRFCHVDRVFYEEAVMRTGRRFRWIR